MVYRGLLVHIPVLDFLAQPGTDIIAVLVGVGRARIPPGLHLHYPQADAKETSRAIELALGKHRVLRVATASSIVLSFACCVLTAGWQET